MLQPEQRWPPASCQMIVARKGRPTQLLLLGKGDRLARLTYRLQPLPNSFVRHPDGGRDLCHKRRGTRYSGPQQRGLNLCRNYGRGLTTPNQLRGEVLCCQSRHRP